jgi:hypothetical protein
MTKEYFIKQLRSISYLITMLILLQSCVVYNSHRYTPYEASLYTKGFVKIKTIDGAAHKLPWVEVQDENVMSILKTKRVLLEKSKVIQISGLDSTTRIIPIDSAMYYHGIMQIQTPDNNGTYRTYEVFKVAVEGDMIHGYTVKDTDTVTVFIPISEIKKIKVYSPSGTITLNALGVFIITLATLGIYAMASWGSNW